MRRKDPPGGAGQKRSKWNRQRGCDASRAAAGPTQKRPRRRVGGGASAEIERRVQGNAHVSLSQGLSLCGESQAVSWMWVRGGRVDSRLKCRGARRPGLRDVREEGAGGWNF